VIEIRYVAAWSKYQTIGGSYSMRNSRLVRLLAYRPLCMTERTHVRRTHSGLGLILFREGPRCLTLAVFSVHYHVERNHQGKGNKIAFPAQVLASAAWII
jgi:hypothetical protein